MTFDITIIKCVKKQLYKFEIWCMILDLKKYKMQWRNRDFALDNGANICYIGNV